MTIRELFEHTVEQYPDKLFLMDEEQRITYQELYKEVKNFNNNLAYLGLRRGSKVCLLLSSTKEFIVSFLGLSSLGCTVIPLDPKIQNELITFVNDSSTELIIVESGKREFVEQNLDKMPSVKMVFLDEKDENCQEGNGYHSLRKLFTQKIGDSDYEPELSDSDIACFIYTSGTVKKPKGVMLSHNCLTFNVYELNSVLNIEHEDIIFNILPYYHCYGLCTNLLTPIMRGATVVLHHNYMLHDIMDKIEETKATVLSCVPLMFEKLKTHLDKKGKITVKKFISSGAKLPYPLIAYYKENYDIDIINAYGSSETNTISVNSDCYHSSKNSVGKLLPSLEVKILGDMGEEMPLGEDGEIVLKTRKIMVGYYNMKEETEEVLRDGWYYTGDIGHVTEERELFITGRKKQMFNVAGKKVYKDDVENVLLSSNYFKDVNVYACEDIKRGEKIIADVILKDNATTKEDILHYLRKKMAPHKIPREINFCSELNKRVTWKTDM